jgi:ABC-2 type transport system ATP-binding protein
VGTVDGTITIEGLTKRFGPVTAVDDLSVVVQPGRVTGFLGPNGSGKTTTLRCTLGLVTPNAGRTLVGGAPYQELPDPVRTVGAALEATGFYPGRTALDHLRVVADAAGIGRARCVEVLGLVGLAEAADRKVIEFSLGMRQRLTLATALLGDPQFLLLDEPANGLDPQGIAWLRQFLQYLAAQGRTVLVSSHVLAEVQQTVDDVIIIRGGRLVLAQPLADLVRDRVEPLVRVRTPSPALLRGALVAELPHARVQVEGDVLLVRDAAAAQIGGAAFRAGVELHELAERATDLEQVFLDLTSGPAA